MLTNFFKIAFRNLSKNRLFSLLNIVGLATGLSVSLLMGLYVRDELSFDRFHDKADRIYRINMDVRNGGQEQSLAVAPAPMGPAMVRDYPEVENMCRFRQWGFITVKKGEEAIEEGANSYVDSTFFDIFSVPLLEGNPKTALAEPGTVVISEKMAQKYFGTTTGLLGKTLRINENRDDRITGVMQDIPAQSHFHYDFLFSMASIREEAAGDIWLSNNFQTYLLLRPDVSAKTMASHFEELIDKYIGPQFEKLIGGTVEDFLASGNWLKYSMIPMADIHLHSDRVAEHEANSDIKYVWIFGSVALMVLLLACVNFMNLSTARSSKRAREVGVRKALGSNRNALIRQFMIESLVLTLIAFVVATAVVIAVLPVFNRFAAKDIGFSLLEPSSLAVLATLALVTAMVAGSYPAFFLSAFKPIETLKGKLSVAGKGSSNIRSSLVVFQFFTSIALIACVLVVKQQLVYIQQKKLGYEREHLLMLRNTWWLQQKTLDFKSKLLQIPGIANVSAADFLPIPSSRTSTNFNEAGKDVSTSSMSMQYWLVDFDYQKTLGLKVVQGRWLDERLATDTLACVVNESTVKAFGWDDPIGKKVHTYTTQDLSESITYEVVGVVENFHYESLRQTIEPMVLAIGRESGTMALKLSSKADVEKTMAAVGVLFKKYLPAQPFNYRFIDEEFNRQYATEQRIGSILSAFAGFAIFIACLGLFGLAAFTAEQRTKEIGIRKVLGATVAGITGLLARDFLKLVLVALVLAAPVAWFFMDYWLSDFAYRVKMPWWVFVLSGMVAVIIAFATVSFQSVRAALANPVESLRSE